MGDVAARLTPLVVVAVAALAAGCGTSSSAPNLGGAGQIAPVKQRVAAPDLKGSYIGGGSLNLAALKGHVVVLNVFGHWCEPCKAEQPGISTLATDLLPQGVMFVGLAERDDDADVKAYQNTYAVPYPAVEDVSGSIVATFRALPVDGVPSTLIIDKQGREAARFVGPAEASALKPVVTALNAEPA